jgi:hypothetical protein
LPIRLSTTLTKIQSAANSVNGSLLLNLYEYMKNNGSSDSRINNTLKTNSLFAHFLGPEVSFYDVTKKNQITLFLDTKMKSAEGSSFSSFRLFVPKIQQIIA